MFRTFEGAGMADTLFERGRIVNRYAVAVKLQVTAILSRDDQSRRQRGRRVIDIDAAL